MVGALYWDRDGDWEREEGGERRALLHMLPKGSRSSSSFFYIFPSSPLAPRYDIPDLKAADQASTGPNRKYV